MPLGFRRKKDWCRRGESNLLLSLRRRKLVILDNARNAKNARIPRSGYAAVTRRLFGPRASTESFLRKKSGKYKGGSSSGGVLIYQEKIDYPPAIRLMPAKSRFSRKIMTVCRGPKGVTTRTWQGKKSSYCSARNEAFIIPWTKDQKHKRKLSSIG